MLELPAIDFSSSTTIVAAQIRKAHDKFGFVRLVNHGVPVELLQRVLDHQKEFFAQDLDYKSKFLADSGYRTEGFNPSPSNVGIKIKREHLYLFLRPLSRRDPRKWPDSHKDLVEELGVCSTKVYEKLIVALSMALDLDPLYLRDTLCQGELKQTFCTFSYPNNEKEEERDEIYGVPEHTDIGTLVLLFADGVPSLQVLLEGDGKWHTVKPLPGSFIVSFGEIMEVMSNGIYRATTHRVTLDKCKPRCSCAITFEPSEKAQIGPASSLLDKSRHSRVCYRRFIYGERYKEYEDGKFLKDFAKS
ncbi:hypothetical protein SELMODRAFT_443154 [Selaginella moellendorffii]|uniref:Fe2OG dioxygenase domain-containing protein n=1 Tax=Selaginella moellendorffii TaxID=88036 RepID=D8RZ20_SELML|nr:flavanone 3-dioxygenase 2 isoform X2 [Selaginella moellendorffii]EFJ22671.1 hypothetical protein SELMODRAFT_443154 [Selaginella moellendorffii]|eukprot:XP_002976411.1 flavanone 3-dioxygenase 2 isoform X2 [Selaginella moellendorffii]